jgi:Ca2+-binding EF-hand superfamily protein
VVVQKFAELGWDPEAAFDVLDDDGDGALTIKEI